jgi:hypothetical protein
MWMTILKYAVKVAFFAANHPDQVKSIVDNVLAARRAVGATKDAVRESYETLKDEVKQ